MSSSSMDLLMFLLLLVSPVALAKSSSTVPAIFTFGDSIFDAGNNHYNKNCTAQADFPPYGSSFFHRPTGRFTNGRTVADFISQFVGLPLQKPFLELQIQILNGTSNFSNGINFASAGSGLLFDTNKFMGVTPIQTQLQQFQTLAEQNLIEKSIIQESLFLLETGSNDIFNYFIPFQTPTLSPDAYVNTMLDQVSKTIDQIYKLGARRIAFFSLGPVGCVPAREMLPNVPTNKCFGKMNVMAKIFNTRLEEIVNIIPTKYPGAIAVFGAVYGITHRFQTNPARYGFTDVSNACCGNGTLGGLMQCGREGYKICNNPNEFLFWDFYHPTERTYHLMSKALWNGNKNHIRPFNLMALATTNITF
ncbi:GDSL-motif lipase/hydrolase 6 [Arabidopsis lyrata subsp. lyrata]|uniref:GDSL-motif lipase/hydrolase 6 n=1 Tax=Arabidopsis lyrata subsp. lyrata TaxID=81972 RepID=D7KYI9_ARALL|nr:GDSL esterase/lipase 6 [Arabidopsis lyrata subsp. lyrata]EFH65081.1 GDSL-motif lipase/hydrolase 6 [Arabidopsis lyrata subsp. lyrata]|eukprot:XP_002888822.1 GDSL esterase/lipase 6 [Arabidopsis lyrata subsp. lyrata]